MKNLRNALAQLAWARFIYRHMMKIFWILRHPSLRFFRLIKKYGYRRRLIKFSRSIDNSQSSQDIVKSFFWREFMQNTYQINFKEFNKAVSDTLHNKGQSEYDPNPFFDTDFYATQYSLDLSKSNKAPFMFYLTEGAAKGHRPSPIFDSFLVRNTFDEYKRFVAPNQEQIFKDLFVGRTESPKSPSIPPSSSKVSLSGLEFDKVAILVPVFNNWTWTERCLRALHNCYGLDKAQVYVIDDCSTDGTAKKIGIRFPWVRVLVNPKNLGFLQSCNRAFELVRKDYEFVLLLNNDTEPHHQFLAELLHAMKTNDKVALAGSKLVYPDGKVQEAGGIIWSDGSGWNFGRNQNDRVELISGRSVDYVSGASVLIRVSSINGPLFDVAFLPAYYEDTDLAFRLRSEGFVVQYVPYSIVLHHEGKSHGIDTSDGVKRFQLSNQKRFAEKWTKVLSQHHRPDPLAVIPAAFRLEVLRAKGVVLWIDYQLPDPTQDSGSVRAVELAKLLRELGYLILFVPQNGDFNRLNPYWMAREGILLQRSLSRAYGLMSQLGVSPDNVILSRVAIAQEYLEKIRYRFPNARIVFDTVDLHFLRLERQAQSSNSKTLRKVARQTREAELEIIRKVDVTLVVSDAELDLLRKINPQAELEIVSNIHNPETHIKKPPKPRGMVFVGSFNHPPNEEGIGWFLDHVWMKLPEEIRTEGLRIVGSNPPDWLKNFPDTNVMTMGWVESSIDVVSCSRISIAPLLSGAGVKGKVGEAMAALTPVVGTTVALEGMGLVNYESCIIADSAEAFASAISSIFQDPTSAEELSSRAIEVLKLRFGPGSAKLALARALRI